MLRTWLLLGLLPICLCSGLYPAPSVTSVEAHGPLARLSLHHGLPLGPAALLHSSPHRLEDVAVGQVPVAELQAEARHPAIQKQYYFTEQGAIVQPVFSTVSQHDEPFPSQFVFFPTGQHTLAQVNQPLLYPVDCNPVVFNMQFQEPDQSFHPEVSQEVPKPPQQYPANPQPPHLLPSVPHQPQQLPTVPTIPQVPFSPQGPQRPVNTDTKPSDLFSSFPTPSPPSTDEFSNDEFDYSDAIVVENPDFTRSRQSGQSTQDQKNEDSKDEFGRETWFPELTSIQKKKAEQERIIQNIVSDFTNLQLLRMSSSPTVPIRASTVRSDYQTTSENPILPIASQNQEEAQTKNNQMLRKPHQIEFNGNNNIDFILYENEKNPSSHSSLEKPSSEKDVSLQYRLYLNHLQTLSDQTKTTADKTKSDKIGDISFLRDMRLEDDVRRRLLELVTGSERTEMSSEATVKGRLLTTPCDKTHVHEPVTRVSQPLTHEQQSLTHEHRVEHARTLQPPVFY